MLGEDWIKKIVADTGKDEVIKAVSGRSKQTIANLTCGGLATGNL